METPYVVLLFVVGLRLIQRRFDKWYSVLPVIVLPFFRPDAVAFSCILAFSASLRKRAPEWRYIGALMVGFALYAGCNRAMIGSWLPYTLMAKKSNVDFIACANKVTWPEMVDRVSYLLLAPVPIWPKQLFFLQPLVLLGWFGLTGYWWLKLRDGVSRAVVSGVLLGVIAVSAAYAVGRLIYPWYLWPSGFLIHGSLTGMVYVGISRMKSSRVSRGLLIVALGIVLCFAGIQLLVSVRFGSIENDYRAGIGERLAAVSKPGDTCFLEPAGLIPFHARDVRIIDEVGLASPVALRYMSEYGERWWIELVKRERPVFLVQREHIMSGLTYSGCGNSYRMAEDELRWLHSNYRLLEEWHYDPESHGRNLLMKRILSFGNNWSQPYYLFRRVD